MCVGGVHLFIHLFIHLSINLRIYAHLKRHSGEVMSYLLNLEFSICSGVVGGHEPLLETLDSLLAHFLLQRHTAVHRKGKVIILQRLIRNFIASMKKKIKQTAKSTTVPCCLPYTPKPALTLEVCSCSRKILDTEGQTLF